MLKYLLINFGFLVILVNLIFAQEDIELLRRAAQSEITREEVFKTEYKDITFKSGGLSLQSLNPEISITGDMYGYYNNQEGDRERVGFAFRGLGIHFESYLDPYSKFKAAVPVEGNTAELGEAYFTRFGFVRNLNVTLGKFRQQFGVVNRWHKHGLDQFDFPLALRKVFGEGGLNQIGISFDWTPPQLFGTSQNLIFQVTNGENTLFSSNTFDTPSILFHYKNYSDLSDSTYFEMGFSGLVGWNDSWDVLSVATIETCPAVVVGLDFTLFWEPVNRMRYRNFEWRSEIYSVSKDILAPDGSGKDTLKPWGVYTYLQEKVSRTIVLGVRVDYYKPDVKSYATTFSPLAATNDDAHLWQISPYVTWYQSPFVRFRLEYNHMDGDYMGPAEKKIILQCIFAAGPHKHERY